MSGYLYMLQTKSNNDENNGIKIGRTTNINSRLNSREYKNCILIQFSRVTCVNIAESELKELFNKYFTILEGSETFIISKIDLALKLFNSIVEKYMIDFNDLRDEHDKNIKKIKKLALLNSSSSIIKMSEDSSSEPSEPSEPSEQGEQGEDTTEEAINYFDDFEENDPGIKVVNGKLLFSYVNKWYSTPKNIKDSSFEPFKTQMIRLHDNKIYIYKQKQIKGWYYVGKKHNSEFINELKLYWTPDTYIKLKERSKNKNVYTLIEQ